MPKTLSLIASKVSLMGFSTRAQDGKIVQAFVGLRVEYRDNKGNIETKDETLYVGNFKNIVGSPMPDDIASALTLIYNYFNKLVNTEYDISIL